MSDRTVRTVRWSWLSSLLVALSVAPAHAAEYWLRAAAVDLTMPDGVTVPMWGFATDNATFTAGNAAQIPGPALEIPPGDDTLIVHVFNQLPEPVSLVIPGLSMPAATVGAAALAPVKFTDAQGRARVRSFTAETAPGAVQTYAWDNVRPGTYLYHSGTHPQIQVQMGLYGSLKHNAAAGMAYTGIAYDTEVTLLYSEIDPQLHAAVASGDYGTAPTSAIDYTSRYFLVNGTPFTAGSPALAAGATGTTTLLRFINAGLSTHVPVIQGLHANIVAEDANPLADPRRQYSITLPALKTIDALLTPAPGQEGDYAVYDRRLNLTNGTLPDGGMLIYLSIAGATGAPQAADDNYQVNEDTLLTVPAPGVLGNDTAGATPTAVLQNGAANGTVQLAANGSFLYQPGANFSGVDSFTYTANDGNLSSNVATVSITVQALNDAPVAQNDAYAMAQGGTLTVAAPGVLGNDTDADGDTLSIADAGTPSNGSVAGTGGGGFIYQPTPDFTGIATIDYRVSDSAGALSNIATVSITVNPNQAPLAANDTGTTTRNTATTINVIANDSDPDGTIDPATVAIVTAPIRGGTATPHADGTITFTPRQNFLGTDAFSYAVRDNLGGISNTAIVRVNVTR